MSSLPLPPLAHAGEGATWQALLTLVSLGLVALFVLVVVGRVRLRRPDDLVLPLAAIAILASLSGATSTVLSDWVGWAFPAGVVALLALLAVAFTPLALTPTTPVTFAATALGVVAALVFQGPIVRAWHPTTVASTEVAQLAITAPAEGSEVATSFAVAVSIVGDWRIVPPDVTGVRRGHVKAFAATIEGETRQFETFADLAPAEDCAAGCTSATYTLDLAPGRWRVQVEFVAADGTQFATTTFDSVDVTVAG